MYKTQRVTLRFTRKLTLSLSDVTIQSRRRHMKTPHLNHRYAYQTLDHVLSNLAGINSNPVSVENAS